MSQVSEENSNPRSIFDIEVLVSGDVGDYSSLVQYSDSTLGAIYYDEQQDDLWIVRQDDDTWQSELIESDGSVGRYCSASIDSLDHINISYYDASQTALKYAGWVILPWSFNTEVVAPGSSVGEFSSLARAPSGQLVVSFYDGDQQDLWISAYNGSDWQTKTVASVGSVGQYGSLSIDHLSTHHISYYDQAQSALWYANSGTDDLAFESEVIAPGNLGDYSSVFTFEMGNLGVVYFDEQQDDLWIARQDDRGWQTELIESGGSVGRYCDVSINNLDQINISYYDASQTALKYAGWVVLPWSFDTEVVASGADIGAYSSLDLSPEGQFVVSYLDGSQQNLNVSTKTGDTWSTGQVATAGQVGHYSSLSIDDAGIRHISYYDQGQSALWYANSGQAVLAFSTELLVAGNVGDYSSLLRYTSGSLGVIYFDEQLDDLWITRQEGDNWLPVLIEANGSVGRYCSASMDSLDQLNISYYDASQTALKYAGWVSLPWSFTTEVVFSGSDVGEYPSLDLSLDGSLVVSYLDGDQQNLSVSIRTGESWTTETIANEGQVGYFGSLAIDNVGVRHISYYDQGQSALWYANDGSSSSAFDSELLVAGNVGDYSSILRHSEGTLSVVYFDEQLDDLWIARQNGGSWQTEIIESNGSVGRYCSASVDSLSQINISYYDASQSALKYAGWVTLPWSFITEVVAAGSDVGASNSLALDPEGHLAISYLEGGQQDLKYATHNGSNWSVETVASTGQIGYFCALTIDGLGNRHISYYDQGQSALWYANSGLSSLAFSSEVMVAGNVGDYSSILQLSSGALATVFFDEQVDDLWIARQEDSSWTTELIESNGSVGRYCQASVDNLDHINISYYDATQTALKYG